MKKIFPLLILLSFVFTGCNSSNSDSQQVDSGDDFAFQRPEREHDMSGAVKAMVGNEITISMRDMSSLPDEVKNLVPTGTSGMPTGGMAGGGGMGMRGGGAGAAGGMSEEDRAKIRAAMESIKTEDVKVIFPVGILMGKTEINGESRVTIEASLADVKVGSNVTVWLNENLEDDRKIAETVMISPTRSNSR